MSVLRLAIPSPLRRYFDYLPPPGMQETELAALQAGQRVLAPFGQRTLVGYLVAVVPESTLPAAGLKHALEILDPAPLISPRLLELCAWASRYYHHPPGEVYGAAFPRHLREGKPVKTGGEPGWQLTTRGRGLPAGALARAPRQAQALELLQAEPAVSTTELARQSISAGILRQLEDKGLAQRCQLDPPALTTSSLPGLTLNSEQTTALVALQGALGSFSCHLLEGVTGSGKTEVYLQLIATCMERGQQALVLIPEIGLTPQTLGRFQQRFSATIVVIHSGLGEAERYRAWEAARSGEANIIIGTRSAVFTPLANVGVIIVDEEHDGSYKQQDGFRYSARDVAVKRGQLEDCTVLLGSATPSLESIGNVMADRYQLHPLKQRAGSGSLPSLRTLDLRRRELQAGLCPELLGTIEQQLQAGQQVLLFLNRRGYAPSLQCHDCGWLAECNSCDARLTVHRRQRRLRCHHCSASHHLPRECPECHSGRLLTNGLGTEQTEDFLRSRFPNWPVYRVDSDSMQGKHAMQELVTRIDAGDPCILLGTQMLTKGHHFPAVTLVAVLDADALLFSADFRGEERMAQLLTQVAGRAGREESPGQVILQTHYPDHPSLQAILSTDYADLARKLLAGRIVTGMPPAGQLVMLRTDCDDPDYGEQFLQTLRNEASPALPADCSLIGPLPSPMQRRAGKFRSQLLLLATNRGGAQQATSLLVAQAERQSNRRGLKWSVDVDPQDVF